MSKKYTFRGALSGHLGKATTGNLGQPFSSLTHVHFVCRFWEGADFLDAGYLVLCTERGKTILEGFNGLRFVDVELERTAEYGQLSTTLTDLILYCLQFEDGNENFEVQNFHLVISEKVKIAISSLNLLKCTIEQFD